MKCYQTDMIETATISDAEFVTLQNLTREERYFSPLLSFYKRLGLISRSAMRYWTNIIMLLLLVISTTHVLSWRTTEAKEESTGRLEEDEERVGTTRFTSGQQYVYRRYSSSNVLLC